MASGHHSAAPVVLEIGAWYTKCGFAENQKGGAEGAPRLILQKRMAQMMQADLSGKVVLDVPKLTVPKSVAEWKPQLRHHLDDVLFGHLLCNPKDRRVVVVEDMLAPKNFRQALAECLFDLRVPSVLFAPGSLLAILTTGARTGVVCDIGAEEVRVLPVYDGVPMLAAYTTSTLGAGGPSREMHDAIRATLSGARKSSVSAQTLEDIVARACLVPPDHGKKVASLQSELLTSRSNSAELNAWLETRLALAIRLAEAAPDDVSGYPCKFPGVGELSGKARSSPAAVLFGGDEEGDTVAGLVVKAVLACPADIRKELLGNVLLAGGHTMIPGLSGRMLNAIEDEMRAEATLSGLRPSLQIARPQFNANTLGWVGGALVGCDKGQLESFSMTFEDYRKSKETAKERSEEHLRTSTFDQILSLTRDMGLEVMEDEDIMKANLRDSMRDPEAQLPDWTRMVPGSTATPGWYFRKNDESEGREWSKREEPLEGKSGLTGTWQRDVDGLAGSSWMRLPDRSASMLEEALRKGAEKVSLVLASAGTETVPLVSPEQAKDPSRGVEYEVDLLAMKATRVNAAATRNIANEEQGDIPFVRTRDVRRMGTELLGPVRQGYTSMLSQAMPLPARA